MPVMRAPSSPFAAVTPVASGLVFHREPAPTTTTEVVTSTSGALTATSSGTSTSTINTEPFFPEPTQRAKDGSQGTNFAKPLLEYILLGVGVFLLLSLVLKRYISSSSHPGQNHQAPITLPHHRIMRFRQSNHPLTFTSFVTASPSRPSGSNPISRRPTYPRTHALHEVPPYPSPDAYSAGYPAYPIDSHGRYPRYARTRALDIGVGGRRLGGGEDLTDKDLLPAYDIAGGPPKYAEMFGGGAPGVAANLDANVPVATDLGQHQEGREPRHQQQGREAVASPVEQQREDRPNTDQHPQAPST